MKILIAHFADGDYHEDVVDVTDLHQNGIDIEAGPNRWEITVDDTTGEIEVRLRESNGRISLPMKVVPRSSNSVVLGVELP